MTDIEISLSAQTWLACQRFSLIRSNYNLFVIREDADQRYCQNIRHILHGHHISPFYHIHAEAINNQTDISQILRFQKTNDPIRITNR